MSQLNTLRSYQLSYLPLDVFVYVVVTEDWLPGEGPVVGCRCYWVHIGFNVRVEWGVVDF